MSDSGGIPELIYTHPDGRQRNRLEMEQWIREKVPKVHWLRIIASRVYGLPKQVSWDMREIVLKHWLLDEMVRRQQIVGDQLGVNQNQSNDEAEVRQFTQRLAAFIQAGLAVQPQHAEGVDMTTQFQPPPPPMGGPQPNGQTQAYPPGPPAPPPPPQGFAPPPMPPGAPQGYGQPQPPQYQPPPVQPPAPPMAGPPPGYAPPPAPPGAPVGPPMGPPPAPPQAAAPQGGGRRGRGAAAPPAQPVPPMGPPGAPQGFAPAPFPAGPPAPVAAPPPPNGTFAPLPAPQQMQLPMPTNQQAPSAVVDLGPILAAINELKGLVASQAKEIAELKKKVELGSIVTTIVGRAMYQKPGAPDPGSFITELGMPLPQ